MASGTPVIASQVVHYRWWWGRGHAGKLENVFDIARGIAEVLLNGDLREEIVKAAGQRAIQLGKNGRRVLAAGGRSGSPEASQPPFRFGPVMLSLGAVRQALSTAAR